MGSIPGCIVTIMTYTLVIIYAVNKIEFLITSDSLLSEAKINKYYDYDEVDLGDSDFKIAFLVTDYFSGDPKDDINEVEWTA